MNKILTGDVFDRLPELPDESVHMVMTSPPYWNLRDYGVDGQLGLEDNAEDYVSNIADVMDEVKRVLRPDGSLWLNLGDTYDNKDLQQIPARVALELQSRGWVLRNDVTWVKPDPMPNGVKDRLITTTEQIFHFVKSKDYYYDLDSIREEYADSSLERGVYSGYDVGKYSENAHGGEFHPGENRETPQNFDVATPNDKGKNPGDVFNLPTESFPEAHFAVYPPELCEKPIKASCPKDGVVLDPFAGAGTTLLKAKELGRKFLGIELNPKYADMARARVGIDVKDPSNIRDRDGQSGLEAY